MFHAFFERCVSAMSMGISGRMIVHTFAGYSVWKWRMVLYDGWDTTTSGSTSLNYQTYITGIMLIRGWLEYCPVNEPVKKTTVEVKSLLRRKTIKPIKSLKSTKIQLNLLKLSTGFSYITGIRYYYCGIAWVWVRTHHCSLEFTGEISCTATILTGWLNKQRITFSSEFFVHV